MPPEAPLLRRQLLAWLIIPLTLLLTADTLVSYWIALQFSQRAHDRALVELARDVALHVRWINGTPVLDMPEAARALLLTDPNDAVHYEIATPDGVRIEGTALGVPPANRASAPGSEQLYDSHLRGEAVRVAQLIVPARPGAARRDAVVRVAETRRKRNLLAHEILASVVAPQVLLIAIAGALIWGGVRRGLAPIETVRRAVAARRRNDSSPLATGGVPREIQPLLAAINELLHNLDAANRLQSRFIGDAAHHLKTPMAALQAHLELAMRERDPARMRAALASAQAGLDRMSRVVSQVLALARNEPEAIGAVKLMPLDLNALALQACADWVPQAMVREIDLGFEGAGAPVPVSGDPARLRELLDNLLDNAIRYSAPGGHVTLRVTAVPAPRIAVCDDSPRIPAEERERIFERFYRPLGTRPEGSGLGLAIVREIAHLHGADVALADDSDGSGHAFTVTFPQTALTTSSSVHVDVMKGHQTES